MNYENLKSISPGLSLSNYCELCGKLKKAKNHNSDACSKKKQKIYESRGNRIDQSLHLAANIRSEEKTV